MAHDECKLETKLRMAELASELMPVVTASVHRAGSADPAVLALAYVAGQIIAAVAKDAAHLEEGLSIFADLTADQARGFFALSDEELEALSGGPEPN